MRIHLAVGFTLGALLLGACSAPVATAPPVPDGVLVGGDVSIALPRPASLDPSNILDRSGEIVIRAMCDPLLDIDRETGEYVSSLLDSWVITDGGTRLVLRLKRGLTFPDGTPVTTRDAVFGMSRSARADFAGENAWMLQGIAGSEVLQGFVEATEPRHRTEFAGIRILSDVAFEVTLNLSAPVVLPALTSSVSAPLSLRAAQADPDAFAAAPVCVGPYQPVAPFDPEADSFTLQRVAGYPGVNEAYTGGGQGYLDTITFHWTEPRRPDPATPDVSVEGERIPAPQVAPAHRPSHDDFGIVELTPARRREAAEAGVKVLAVPSPYQQFVGLPPDEFPREARIALSQALDRTAIAEIVLGGAAAPSRGWFTPQLGSRLYNANGCGDVAPATSDLPLARRTLEEAGIDFAGVSLHLATNPDFDNVRLVQAVAGQWLRAFPGLHVTVDVVPWQDYRLEFERPEGFSTGFRQSQHVPFASPDAWLRGLWSGSIGSSNAVAYANQGFDELLGLDAAEAIDPVDQAVIHRTAHQLICDDLPMIPIVMDLRHYSLGPGIVSATGRLADLADPVTGGLRLRELFRL